MEDVKQDELNHPLDEQEAECLRIVHEMMMKDENLKPMMKFWTDRLMLILVRSYEYDTTRVLNVAKYLHLFCTQTYPELLALVNLTKLKPTLDKKIFKIVKNVGDKNPGICVIRIKRWKPSESSTDQMIAAGLIYAYQMSRDCLATQKNGIVVMIDTEGVSFNQARHVTYDFVKKLMHCLTHASPVKVLGYVAYNSHMLIEKVFSIVKYAVPERLRKDIHIIKRDFTPLYAMVPEKELLPVCLGGEVCDEMGFVEGVEEDAMLDNTMEALISNVQKEYNANIKNSK